MRYSRTDLLQLKDYILEFDEDITFDEHISKQFPRIRRINKINVVGNGQYNPEEQRLYINLKVKGSIVCGCDITNEDVQLPIDTDEDFIYTFNRKEEDINVIKSEGEFIELLPTIFQLIMLEVPIKVVKQGKVEYPKGEGWQVISEQEYLHQKKSETDPRLAVLKNFKPQD